MFDFRHIQYDLWILSQTFSIQIVLRIVETALRCLLPRVISALVDVIVDAAAAASATHVDHYLALTSLPTFVSEASSIS